jgi:DNA-binding transcriptional regulator YhcF (GntR family)
MLSNEFIRLTLRSDIATPAQITVMVILADAADKDGVCWPSVEFLAQACRMGRSTVLRILGELEADGFVNRKRRRAQSSVITISRERLAGKSQIGTSETRKSQIETSHIEKSRIEKSHLSSYEVPDRDRSKENPKRTLITSEVSDGHPEARKLCERLVDLRVANGCRKPTLGKTWLDAARLMLTKDGRSFPDALAVLEWSQADTFWKPNIQSMPTFREKYDQLRLQAEAKGALVPQASRLDSPESVTAWLRREWESGRVRDIEERTGLRYRQPDLPAHLSDKTAIEQWLREQARHWIADNRELITQRLARRTA